MMVTMTVVVEDASTGGVPAGEAAGDDLVLVRFLGEKGWGRSLDMGGTQSRLRVLGGIPQWMSPTRWLSAAPPAPLLLLGELRNLVNM